MSTLLGFNTDPSRQNLMVELNIKGLLSQVPPELRQLHEQLERTFHPLTIAADVKPLLDHLTASGPALAMYVPALERIVVLRLLEQLSQIYHTVSLDKFEEYLGGLSLGFQEVEKIIVRAVKTRQLKVSVDHLARCLRFGQAGMETEGMRTQLSSLARQLDRVTAIIHGPADQSKAARERLQLFDLVASSMQRDHTEALGRKEIIEKRKEDTERREQEKQREAARVKAEEEAKRREEESRRLEREARLREKEKLQKIEDKMALDETKQMLARLGKKVDDTSVWEGMGKSARDELIRKTKDEAKRAKEEEDKKVREQARRLDYVTRALRLEEMPVLKEKNAKQVEEDRHAWEVRWAEHLVHHRLQHEKHRRDAAAFRHMQPSRAAFEERMQAQRLAQWEEEMQEEEVRVREERQQMRMQRALRRRNDAIRAAAQEREEKARAEREAEESARLAAEREAERAQREAERAQREAEEEERRKNMPPEPEQEPEAPQENDGAAPRSGVSWRGGGGGSDERSGGGYDRAERPGPRGGEEAAPSWRRGEGAAGAADEGGAGGRGGGGGGIGRFVAPGERSRGEGGGVGGSGSWRDRGADDGGRGGG
ncbi:unnamed protein product, partial [Phaeothamnion confervicola]